MSTPGAVMSTPGPAVENDATTSFSSLAAIVNTWGQAAGYVAGLPSSPLLPAAATIRHPFLNAVSTASCSIGSSWTPPQLRLITAGQCCVAARTPAMPVEVVIPKGVGLASKRKRLALGYTPARAMPLLGGAPAGGDAGAGV